MKALKAVGGPESAGFVNAPLEAFIAALAAMTTEQRAMTMLELEARICLFCGAADPSCECWLPGEAEAVQ